MNRRLKCFRECTRHECVCVCCLVFTVFLSFDPALSNETDTRKVIANFNTVVYKYIYTTYIYKYKSVRIK